MIRRPTAPRVRSAAMPRPACRDTGVRSIDGQWDLGSLVADFPPARSEAEIQAIVAELTRELTA